MRPNRFVRLAVALLAPLLVAGGVVAQAGTAFADAGHHSHVLYVSARAMHWNSDRSCRSAAFKTIQSAVNAAQAGGTVVVCPGTYHEQVVISKPLTLAGKEATIDETGVTPTFQVTLPGLGTQTIFAAVVMASSGIDFTGFKVQHAQGEGILAAGLSGTVSGIVISRNAVVHNDLGGGVPPKSTYFQCAAQGQVPGDCGEGVPRTTMWWRTTSSRATPRTAGSRSPGTTPKRLTPLAFRSPRSRASTATSSWTTW